MFSYALFMFKYVLFLDLHYGGIAYHHTLETNYDRGM